MVDSRVFVSPSDKEPGQWHQTMVDAMVAQEVLLCPLSPTVYNSPELQ